MDPQDWLKAKVDYFKKNGAGARPLTLTVMATNYMSFDIGTDGRLDQFLYADPQMWCAPAPAAASARPCARVRRRDTRIATRGTAETPPPSPVRRDSGGAGTCGCSGGRRGARGAGAGASTCRSARPGPRAWGTS
jgi:hypothetical protein